MLSCFEERTLESIDALLSTSNVIYGELYKSKSATAVVPGNNNLSINLSE